MSKTMIPKKYSELSKYKTHPCKYALNKENCWAAAKCKFAHSINELRSYSDPVDISVKALYNSDEYELDKQEMKKGFRQNTSTQNHDSQVSHENEAIARKFHKQLMQCRIEKVDIQQAHRLVVEKLESDLLHSKEIVDEQANQLVQKHIENEELRRQLSQRI